MIRVTGDIHRRIEKFVKGNPNFIHDTTWGEEDVLIVAGDFGFVLLDTPEEHDWLDWLERTKPYTICFVDGNHENFPRIFEYPEEEIYGGKAHRIRKNIYHLMRGQVFEIQGKKIFTMGGAYSIDLAERRNYLLRHGVKIHWEEELPNDAEYKEAVSNLKKHDFAIDYIVTHTAPKELILHMGFVPDPHDYELTGFLEYVMYECKDFQKWFYGHWHIDEEYYGGKFRALLNDVVTLE